MIGYVHLQCARLGCDWFARADGIDGATASFVLCGQHGKTTRQQKLLDAKLKRVAQEGAAAKGVHGDDDVWLHGVAGRPTGRTVGLARSARSPRKYAFMRSIWSAYMSSYC